MWNVATNTGSHPNVWKIQQLSQTNDEALTSASFANRASSCNWKSLRSISSLARSASSLICFSRARIWRSIWMKAKKQNHSKNNHLWSNSYDFSFHMYVWTVYIRLFSSGAERALTFFRAFSSLAWAFICCTSMESTFRLLMNRSWLPMHNCKIWIHRRYKPVISYFT